MDTQAQNTSLTAQLQGINKSNNLLSAEISDKFDLATIEQIATTKLGMTKPKPSQIIHINVPPAGYVVQSKPTPPEVEPKSAFMKKLSGMVSQLGL